MNLKELIVTLTACIGSFSYGISLGWSSPASTYIVDNENYAFPVNSRQFGFVVAIMLFGGTIACSFAGVLRERIGTKWTISAMGLPMVLGYVLLTSAHNLMMLLAGRFFIGLSGGIFCTILPIYIGEISSSKIRGALLSVYQMMVCIGILFIFVLGYSASLSQMNIICGCISAIYVFLFLFLPESPAFLVFKEREDEARRCIQRLRGKSYACEVELDELKKLNEKSQNELKYVLSDRASRKAFKIIIALFFFFQMSGINIIAFYSSMIFTEAQTNLNPAISSIIVAALQAGATFLATAFSDKFGRRILMIVSNALMLISLIGIGTYFVLKDADLNVANIKFIPLLSLAIFVTAFSLGMGPVTFILFGELFSQEAKIILAPICQFFGFLFSFLVGFAFPFFINIFSFGVTFYIFAASTFIAILFVKFYVPETKKKSLAEIQQILDRK